MTRKFSRMSNACALVMLARHLNYEVYKEVIKFDSTKIASYRIKNNRGEIFAGDLLSETLAECIKNDLKPSMRRGGRED